MASDQELIYGALAGDRAAFDILVRRYQDGLFRHLLRLTGDPEQAEDLAQEAFLRFYTALSRFERGRSVGPYLFKIATNLWRDRLRRPAFGLEVNGLAETADGCRVDEEALRRIERQAIVNAMEQLRPEYQEVLSLRYDQGLSYREITEVTGAPAGTVAIWLHRALEALRLALHGKCAKEVQP